MILTEQSQRIGHYTPSTFLPRLTHGRNWTNLASHEKFSSGLYERLGLITKLLNPNGPDVLISYPRFHSTPT